MTGDRISSKSGFAMPLTMLVLVVLAVGITGSFAFVTSETRVIDNITQQQNAILTAQSGLDEFLSNRAGLGFTGVPAPNEAVTVSIRDGTAQIVLERLRPAVGPSNALYVVRSTGVIPGPRPQDAPARRTVAQMAEWQTGTMGVKSGWTALSGLHKNGNAGTISGEDRCGVAPDLPGVSLPQNPGFTASGNFEPDGDPPVEEWPDVEDLIDQLGINWEGIASMSALTPDVVMPGDPWPSFGSPDFWPVIHVTGDFALPSTGRGVLIVTGGGMTVNGNKTWSGVVLVGEHLTSNGNNKVYGATYTGLDALLQDDPTQWLLDLGTNSTGNGNKSYEYDSCMISQALTSFGGLRVIENAWMDNWPAP